MQTRTFNLTYIKYLWAMRNIRLEHPFPTVFNSQLHSIQHSCFPACTFPVRLHHSRHVVFGLPLFLVPFSVYPRVTSQSLFLPPLIMCLIQFHLCLFTSPLILPVSAISRIVSLEASCCHLILKILLKHFD